MPIRFFLLCSSILLASSAIAQRGDRKDNNQPDPPASLKIPPAPVLSPEEALESFTLVDGFEIQIVAAEPLIHDPVAIRIDENGRIWVVEMQSFMPDVDGKGEDAPSSRIVILEDSNGDGRMDKSKVFLDQLVLPRALQFVRGGVLYADQKQLYFVPLHDGDRAGEPVVVDSNYSGGGNVEHKSNGLLRGLDNWLYNAKSSARYREIDGEWVKEKTESRGQWGISQDDYGRLFYNGNSSNVYGDWVAPSLMLRNPNINSKITRNGTVVPIVRDSRVYPIRVNTGVNRGYKKGTLGEDFKLRSLTAACGPLIYRGTNFPGGFYGNAFTPAPCCHLIKRNLITDQNGQLKGEQAYKDHEFLASTDERFRPVALENAPDGSLYVVDFYRGIIQHKTYVTSYLRRQIESRKLGAPVGLGRIYRIVHKGEKAVMPRPNFSAQMPQQWVAHLRNPNAWWRETAQRLIVDRGEHDVVDDLVELCGENDHPLAQIHALWTLEGLGKVSPAAIGAAARSENPKVLAAAVRLAEKCDGDVFSIIRTIAEQPQHADVELQLAFSLGQFKDPTALPLLEEIMRRRGAEQLFVAATLSGLRDREAEFLTLLEKAPLEHKKLIAILTEMSAPKLAEVEPTGSGLSPQDQKRHALGKTLYAQFCFACHGERGEGVTPLAPPIAESEWVTGSPLRLAAIVLNGVEGPITIGGKVYDAPEIQPLMPGLKDNPEYDDEKLAAILTYIRNDFGNRAPAVTASTIKKARKKFAHHDLFTERELRAIK
ncbi:MAG: glucose/arabinose dehydrogenase/mono/diheme cytochrome c family protein [Verrucomicrobiales bacterium]|jgi:glucose/arabinose dehydrogenase/mono/diheme cytochrome c family protein